MERFQGFTGGEQRLVPIPSQFFTDILPSIVDIRELKLLLYIFWRLDRLEDTFRYIVWDDFIQDEKFMMGLGNQPQEAEESLRIALERATENGWLLRGKIEISTGYQDLYFLNSPKGRAAIQAIQRGEWRHTGETEHPLELMQDQPNIFGLYEQNIGPLTPMIADTLTEAEDTYPYQWIEEAIRIAVENNKRSWRYVLAILDRWQQEGKHEGKDRRDTEKARRRYAEWEG